MKALSRNELALLLVWAFRSGLFRKSSETVRYKVFEPEEKDEGDGTGR